MTAAATAVVLLGSVSAVLLLLAPAEPRPAAPKRSPSPGGLVVVAVVMAVLGVLAAGREHVPLALVLIAAAWSGWSFWRRRRRRREEQQVAERVREACEHLAAELQAGQAAGAALDQVSGSWDVLAPVAEAQRVGADVPAALRLVSHTPGAGDLRLLAAAWQVAHRTGQGLAAAVDRVAVDLVAARRTRRVVEGELASARATARLVAGLPLLAWAMGSAAGGDPVGFLLHSPVGIACLALGVAFGLAGLSWIEAIARAVDRSP